MSIFDKVKAAAQGLSDKAKEWVDAGIDKFKESLDALLALADRAELDRVGYRLTDVEIEVSLTPRIVVFLDRTREVDDEAFAALLANHKDDSTVSTLLKALQQANAMDRRLRPRGRSMAGLRAELGVPPVLSLRYIAAEPVHPRTTILDEHIEDY